MAEEHGVLVTWQLLTVLLVVHRPSLPEDIAAPKASAAGQNFRRGVSCLMVAGTVQRFVFCQFWRNRRSKGGLAKA